MRIINKFPTSEVSIQAATRKGNPIDNAQCYETGNIAAAAEYECASYERLNKKNLIERNHRTGIYNCHGLSFLSRRSGVWEDNVIEQILREDNYNKVEWNKAGPGDIVLYISKTKGYTHSALVLQTQMNAYNIKEIIVISKWGTYKEFIHPLAICPFEADEFEFWRVKD